MISQFYQSNFLTSKIKIASVPLVIKVESVFKNIPLLFKKFEDYYGHATIEIIIKKADKRNIEIFKNLNQLVINGKFIDNLKDPFNLIGILQAIFRFVGLHSPKQNIFLLHGSAALFKDGEVYCFGDDAKSESKTLSSVECALTSNNYIGDEFCFFDFNTNEIFSYPFIPIHFRPLVKKHFMITHSLGNLFFSSDYQKTKAGFFVEPTKIFNIINSVNLSAFVFVYFTDTIPKIIKLNQLASIKALKVCLSASLLKLFNPQLDRMNFIQRTDRKELKIQISSANNSLPFNINFIAKKLSDTIPCYKAFIQKPCDLSYLLMGIKNL